MTPKKSESFAFDGPRNEKLWGRVWKATQGPIGTVLGTHGYSEHSGCYRHFADFLNRNGFNVFLFDLPGHGLSDGESADIDDFEDYVSSFDYMIHEARARKLPEPYFFFGHSLGGLVIIRYLQSRAYARLARRVVLSSPLLGLSSKCFHGVGQVFQVEWGRKALGLLTQLLPNIRIPNESQMGADLLSHDPEMKKRRRADQLIRPSVTIHWTREFLRAVEKAHEGASLIRVPLGVFQAGEDYITDAQTAETFVRSIGSEEKIFRTYPGLYHEILNETERDQVMRDMLHWLLRDESLRARETGSI